MSDAPVRRRTNQRAIASVVFSVVWILGLGSAFALWLGITARKQIRASPDTQSGMWLAYVGIALSSFGLAFIAVALGIAAAT